MKLYEKIKNNLIAVLYSFQCCRRNISRPLLSNETDVVPKCILNFCIYIIKVRFPVVIIELRDTRWFLLLFLSAICPLTPALDCSVYNMFSPFIFKLMGRTIDFIGPLLKPGPTIMKVQPTRGSSRKAIRQTIERSQSIMSNGEHNNMTVALDSSRIRILDLHKSVLRFATETKH